MRIVVWMCAISLAVQLLLFLRLDAIVGQAQHESSRSDWGALSSGSVAVSELEQKLKQLETIQREMEYVVQHAQENAHESVRLGDVIDQRAPHVRCRARRQSMH